MKYVIGFFIFAVMALTVGTGLFVVDQRQYAIVFAMGEVKEIIEEPGLYFKLPAPMQNVLFLDKRILSTETHEPDRIITAEKMNILVDSYVKWRIVDPKLFYVSFGGDEQRTQDRMAQIVKAALNDEITKRTVSEVISGNRDEMMAAVKNKMARETEHIGVEIIDVRLKRVDYVEQINHSVFERMKSERTRVANELRSIGEAESEKIRADADKQRTVILAEALGMNDTDIEIIRDAGLLHDIGKISIPENILKKTSHLTPEEYEIMKTHVENSTKMIRYLPDMDYVIPAVLGHHERYDGKGYPRGLAGEDIPYMARILTIADCFDAMTARRPYKQPLPVSYAVGELEKNSGTQFDPYLTKKFVELIYEGKIVV